MRIGQHGEGREAVEVPGELGAFGQVALGIENDFLRIQTTGQPGSGGGEEVFLRAMGSLTVVKECKSAMNKNASLRGSFANAIAGLIAPNTLPKC